MTAWGITDGSAGMVAQVRGVLEALGQPYVIKICRRRAPYGWLPAAWHRGALRQLTADSDTLTAPWPNLVVTSGRRSVPLALAVKQASGGRTRLVHLTDPRIDPKHFDLVVAMAHDKVDGPNVIKTPFSLHAHTPATLAAACEQWAPRFAALPKPHIAVLIGGSTHKYQFNLPAMRQIIATLKAVLQQQEGSLLITTSRRSGHGNISLLKQEFAESDRVYLHTGEGENPYAGLLACADYLLVTDDSVNMMSEAAFTGKPLYILSLPGHRGTKPARFAASLIQQGIARTWEGRLEHWQYPIANAMPPVLQALQNINKY